MKPQFPNRSDGNVPDLYIGVPWSGDFPASRPGPSMSAGDARNAAASALPTWAAGATVTVVDEALEGRVLTVGATLEPLGSDGKLEDLLTWAIQEQALLNGQGAGISATRLNVADITGTPLFTAAVDPGWGQRFVWASPYVRAYVGNPTVTADALSAEAQATFGDVTGVSP